MNPKGFEWYGGNSNKNLERHGVTDRECEELFFDSQLLVYDDKKHSKEEDRYYALGETISGRRLFVVFAVRNEKIRVISGRDMNRKERVEYEKGEKE